MKTELCNLLKQKREELGETQGVFGKRLFPKSNIKAAGSYYCILERGDRKFPSKHFETIEKVLGVSIDEVVELNQETIPSERSAKAETPISSEELRKLAEISDVLGVQLSVATILRIINDMRETPSE